MEIVINVMPVMIQISDFIKELQGIQEEYGDTCVYIRDCSWGAVALNRQREDEEKECRHGEGL